MPARAPHVHATLRRIVRHAKYVPQRRSRVVVEGGLDPTEPGADLYVSFRGQAELISEDEDAMFGDVLFDLFDYLCGDGSGEINADHFAPEF